jgi:hypothetical protein
MKVGERAVGVLTWISLLVVVPWGLIRTVPHVKRYLKSEFM